MASVRLHIWHSLVLPDCAWSESLPHIRILDFCDASWIISFGNQNMRDTNPRRKCILLIMLWTLMCSSGEKMATDIWQMDHTSDHYRDSFWRLNEKIHCWTRTFKTKLAYCTFSFSKQCSLLSGPLSWGADCGFIWTGLGKWWTQTVSSILPILNVYFPGRWP